MDVEKLNTVKAVMKRELEIRLGKDVPKRALDQFNQTLQIFPDLELIDEKRDSFDLKNVRLVSNARNSMRMGTAFDFIDNLQREFESGELDKQPTSLELKVWGLSQNDYEKLLLNDDLPIEQRNELMEAREKMPNPERDYIDALLDEQTPLSERLEKVYTNNEQKSPESITEAENERKGRLNSESIGILEKIDEILAKPVINEP